MRDVRYTNRFKRDYKREKSGRHGKEIDGLLRDTVKVLAAGLPLPPFSRDHALTGEWGDHRDCHLKPDLVLIYSTAQDGFLDLVRLGSHSELGL